MATYDDLKKRAKGAFDSIADASAEAYKVAEEKTRILARKTKLRASIVNDKATIRRLSVELGTKYYSKYKDDESSEFGPLCNEITEAYEKIAEKECEIAELKAAAYVKSNNSEKCGSEAECTDECESAAECETENTPENKTDCCPECNKEINLFDQNDNM